VFLLVPILGTLCFWFAPTYNIWLPKDVSEHGHKIDHLFYFILFLTGAVFIATEVALFLFFWRYDAAKNPQPPRFTHGSHSLEVVWTILPAATLLFIAIYQIGAWAEAKMDNPAGGPAGTKPLCEVIARQWDWRLRYPGPDGELGTKDDLHLVGDMHVPVGETVLIHLKSQDVLHSFFLPNLRVKQDAVPGMSIPVWFKAMEEGQNYDIVCAELCGGGHYRMKGRLTVESREKFEAWIAEQTREQQATKPAVAQQAAEGSKESS
jgi:cytochrome c oxidase subunit 2